MSGQPRKGPARGAPAPSNFTNDRRHSDQVRRYRRAEPRNLPSSIVGSVILRARVGGSGSVRSVVNASGDVWIQGSGWVKRWVA